MILSTLQMKKPKLREVYIFSQKLTSGRLGFQLACLITHHLPFFFNYTAFIKKDVCDESGKMLAEEAEGAKRGEHSIRWASSHWTELKHFKGYTEWISFES